MELQHQDLKALQRRAHGFWMSRLVPSEKSMRKGTVGAVLMTAAPYSCSRRWWKTSMCSRPRNLKAALPLASAAVLAGQTGSCAAS